MATNIIGPTLGVAQLAATLSGVPFATGSVMVLQMISGICGQVAVQKVSDLWNDRLLLRLHCHHYLLLTSLLSRTAKICTVGSAVHVAN